jgi:pyrroloquinoline quinone biosynthesis protein E
MIGGLNTAVRKAYARAGMLYELHCDLLYQCDLDCEHCYLDDKARRILPTEFWRDVLSQAAHLGVFSVLFSGGEVFLRKDLLDLVAHARALGLFVHLKSHGGHIDRARADALRLLGVSTVWLSYYSTDPAIHDAITRKSGSHAKTRAALGHLAAAGLTTFASVGVMGRNEATWQAAASDAHALGALVSVDGHMRAAHSGADFPKQLAVDLAGLIAIEASAIEPHLRGEVDCDPHAEPRGQAGNGPDGPGGGVALEPRSWDDSKSCGAGNVMLYIGPEGDVMPCVAWPMPIGNLATGDRLADLWAHNARLAQIQAYRRSDRAVCTSCQVRDDCDFCAGQSWIETGDPMAAIQNVCLKTRAKTLAKAAALGLPEPPMPAGLSADPAAAPDARPRFPIRVVSR